MTLDYITKFIDSKMLDNDNVITVTFYEIRIKENLSVEETEVFLHFSKQRLTNLGYTIYTTGEKYVYDNQEKIVDSNLLFVAVKNTQEKSNKL